MNTRLSKLEELYKGKIINIDGVYYDGFGNKEKDNCRVIKFIRAAYGRSCAVTMAGEVFIWGMGFRKEIITKPKFIFRDVHGIKDLQFGRSHGIYI